MWYSVSSDFRTLCCRTVPFFVLAALVSGTGFAEDWTPPTRFVGMGGAIQTYDEAQSDLGRLPWQQVHKRREKATLSLADLLADQQAWREALTSLEVDFTYALERRFETVRVKENQKLGRGLPWDFAFAAHIAIKGDKRYTSFRDQTASALAHNNWDMPLSRRQVKHRPEFVYAFDGAEMRTFEPLRSVGHIHPARLDAIDAYHMWYCDSISMPTGPRAQKLMESVWYLPMALTASTMYRVLPTLQEVDGAKCHVVTSGCDTVWIDSSHGSCIRRRIWFQRPSAVDPAVLLYVYINKDLRQCERGIWLPQKCYRLDFAGPQEPKNTQGELADVHSVVATSIKVNHVPDETFELHFPPGTAVQDLINNKSYIVPHGENLLDDAIAKANPIVNGEITPISSVSASVLQSRRSWLIFGNIAAFSFVTARLWRSRRLTHGDDRPR